MVRNHAFLIQTVSFRPSATDIRALDRLLKAGNKVFIAALLLNPDSLYPDLQVAINGHGFSPMEVKSSIANQSIPYDTFRAGLISCLIRRKNTLSMPRWQVIILQ